MTAMAVMQLFAANYNERMRWVYDGLRRWLAERDIELILAWCTSEDEVIQQAQGAEIYLAYRFAVTRRIIASLPRLRLLMSSGSGYDHIDVKAATEHGVVVTNAGSYNVEDVAEFALALILTCARGAHLMTGAVRRGEWGNPGLAPAAHRFGAQTVGVVGFGNIGRRLAWRARALGFRVLAHDPHVPLETIAEQGVEPASLQELLQTSDFVSLHVRLTDETEHLLGEAQLRAMKPTAHVINTSRGGVIDEAALIRALEAGWIAGAGLDVLEQEPPNAGNPLLAMENVLVTGHTAGTTVEGIRAWQDAWRGVIEDFVAGYWPRNVINPNVRPRAALGRRS